MNPELTLVTVAFKSRKHLDLNLRLVRHLNPHAEYSWLILDNTPKASPLKLDEHDARYTYFPRVEVYFAGSARASVQHGQSFNSLLPHIRTRFALFLDPDFYILRKDWIGDVLMHMKESGLPFFGAPWHPRWYTKYRYFPSAQCLFVDGTKADLQSLDFSPSFSDFRRHRLGIFLRFLKEEGRLEIGRSPDTGSKIYKAFKQWRTRKDLCLVPVFNPSKDTLAGRRHALMDIFFPDKLSFTPKRKGYFSENSAAGNFGLNFSPGWEEFLWKKSLFGFHLRKTQNRNLTEEAEYSALLQAFGCLLPSFIARGNEVANEPVF